MHFVIFMLMTIITASNAQILNGTFLTSLDHFRPQSLDTALFNFQSNFVHYVSGGPFYIYINDARENNFQWLETGLMFDAAVETRAALFAFSHRYFGNNLPTQNATLESLEFLTVEQTLADIAIFIQNLRLELQQFDSNVILWGSGYGGTMATWARKKYPHLVDGAWSSSGIFYADLFTSSQYDFLEYVIASVGSNECSDLLRDAFAFIEYTIENSGGEHLQDRFNLCHPVDTNSMLDIAALYESHINDVFVIINRQQQIIYRRLHKPISIPIPSADKFFLSSNGIRTFCTEMEAIPGDPFESFARWIDVTFGSTQCYDHTFTGQIERFSNTEWNTVGTNTGRRQWYYIQCTQLGSFLVADESSWLPLEIPPTYHIERCEQIFGENYNSEVLAAANANINREFGSVNQSVSNVIYTNGAIDPWLNTGILATRDPNSVVIIIEDYSKSADLTSINLELDTAVLVQAKEQIINQIIEWSLN